MNRTLCSVLMTLVGILGSNLALPSPAQADGLPSYARGDEHIHGRIRSFDRHYHLEIRDERGYIDDVTLRQGTLINPVGLTLSPGMTVTILGVPSKGTFLANEIDTPYVNQYAYPVPALYPYPVPVYGGYGYGYGYYGGYAPYPGATIIVGGHPHWR